VNFAVSLLSFRPGRIGGAETYVRQLLSHLARHAGGDRIVAVAHPEAAECARSVGLDCVVVKRADAALVAERLLEAFTPLRARALEATFEVLRPDAILFPQQSVFPRHVRGRAVLTVHDVQHLAHPENFGALDRAYRAAVYPPSLRRADRVIAISASTKRALVERCAVPVDKIVVVPLGSETTERADAPPWEGPGAAYLYYPAATYLHKNHETLLRTYATLRRSGRVGEKLVFTGQQTSHWRKLERIVRSLGLQDDVVHLGFRPYAEVRAIYAGAAAVLFPTRFEGFGIPARGGEVWKAHHHVPPRGVRRDWCAVGGADRLLEPRAAGTRAGGPNPDAARKGADGLGWRCLADAGRAARGRKGLGLRPM
jgi:glycosyltransferase involved in cell wall biosynthesis